MTDTTPGPRTEAGKALFNDFLSGPGGFGHAGIDRYDLMRGILAIEAEAVGLMYGSDQEAGYAALAEAEAEAAAPDAGLREAAQAVMDEWDALGPTGTHETTGVFARLRAALAAHPALAPEVWNPRRRVGGYYPPVPAPDHNALYEYQQNVIEKRVAPAGPAVDVDLATMYVTMSHNMNAGTGRYWEWWDEKSEGWRKGDSVEFVDALIAAYRARRTSSDPTGESE